MDYIDANIDSRPVYFTVWFPELEQFFVSNRSTDNSGSSGGSDGYCLTA